MTFRRVDAAEADQIRALSELATAIVKEHYDPILGAEQNDYMIRKFQSVQGITDQLEQGYQYYFVAGDDGELLGFLAFYPRGKALYLSKLYLLKEQRGRGYSKAMLAFVIARAKDRGLSAIELNVNKQNDEAIRAYRGLGFVKIREEKNAIGNGFYMDDDVYRYTL